MTNWIEEFQKPPGEIGGGACGLVAVVPT